jgi:hypothetical protein
MASHSQLNATGSCSGLTVSCRVELLQLIVSCSGSPRGVASTWSYTWSVVSIATSSI